jgi:dTDP-L-rhamnose 4-epimerase
VHKLKHKILVTGGAGFIGSFIVDELIRKGHEVRIFDRLDPQVHGKKLPDHLNPKAEFMKGDVRKPDELLTAIQDVDIIFHEAAAVGVGQSMYQISHYMNVNVMGTANLLNLLVDKEHGVKKLLVAGSMSSYGEGSYRCPNCGMVYPELRTEAQMAKCQWELFCPKCGRIAKAVPTPETKSLDSTSIYAISKKVQEEMVHSIGRAYGIPSVSLRYFNVYGPRQSLSNPYTGVAAIFMSRLKNGNPPIINEDGLQTRDFISVHDIARANLLAMESPSANYESFNVGSGKPVTIKYLAEYLAKLYGVDIKPEIVFKYRKGDVRHCFADISKIKSRLGFTPQVRFEAGMKELVDWSRKITAVDQYQKAHNELKAKGLA